MTCHTLYNGNEKVFYRYLVVFYLALKYVSNFCRIRYYNNKCPTTSLVLLKVWGDL